MRDQYWYFMYDSKYHLTYAEKYNEHARKFCNALNYVPALASSAAVAGWHLWERLPWVWSIIIGVSQLISVLKPYLPHAKRMACLGALIPELKVFVTKVESQWNRLSNAPDEQIAKQLAADREAYARIETKHLGTIELPTLPWLAEASRKVSESYMAIYKGGSDNASPDNHDFRCEPLV